MKNWTSADFTAFLDEGRTGLAYFYTPICGTCQVASRMLEVIQAMNPNLEAGKIDLNYATELAEEYEIMSVPCLFFIKEGKVADSIYAFHSVPYLLEKINTVLM
ncbi:thiol reductase thioredoxin [Bacillus sp. FJAT-27225]|uniref:thioredoxin family protein n=1 Tax=Bacillus sp. FJAT-27225 TaxID=1743144 RepID=UPI00080C341F|nr:thioredoxin family protein [Bacillus sp. FJAT-27225]OCA87630.1 thiol reductase thioredoxin [Bacillus sp. FJAT-27225]